MNSRLNSLTPLAEKFLAPFVAILLATVLWLPSMHIFYRPAGGVGPHQGVSSQARLLAARHLRIWTEPALRERELRKMQARNPEWDFMSRTLFVLSLCNMALRDPSYQEQACDISDVIIENTLALEHKKGMHHFLLGYAGRTGPWVMQPARSQFIDGEIALMIAARRLVAEKDGYKSLLTHRIRLMTERMRKSPVLCAESYPDECWLFCNAISLAAIRLSDILDGSDHSQFLSQWVRTAKDKLIDPKTRMLISAYGVDGRPAPAGYSPEGTSIWLACHMLQLFDKTFASEQYHRAKKELGRSFFGFGYSREWPESSPGEMDIDSGPVLPVLNASASASGLAIVAASAFDDWPYFSQLLSSLNLVGFPEVRKGQLEYHASNPVGDAVLLYSLVLGPLFGEAQRRAAQ
jgi:hypothetical protein